jgi:hypothetical protein
VNSARSDEYVKSYDSYLSHAIFLGHVTNSLSWKRFEFISFWDPVPSGSTDNLIIKKN